MSLESLNYSILTPAGRGAIAVIAVWGASRFDAVERHFCPANKGRWEAWRAIQQNDVTELPVPAEPKDFALEKSIFYGCWSTTGEDILVVGFSDRLEIHCHGGEAAAASITRDIQASGGHALDEIEASRRLHCSPWNGALARVLSKASTERTAEILLRQYNRSDELVRLLKEDITENHDRFIERIKLSLEFAEFGLHLTKPWSVVLCGPPNVGKSSLINALVGFERAIVHDVAGTTRDVVSQTTAVAGWPIELKDTAGLRHSDHPIESRGIELSVAEIRQADLVLAVTDCTMDLDEATLELIRDAKASIIVRNKCDLIDSDWMSVETKDAEYLSSGKKIDGGADHLRPKDQASTPSVIAVSALQKINIERLIEMIAARLVPDLPPPDVLIPVEPDQVLTFKRIVDAADFEVSSKLAIPLFE